MTKLMYDSTTPREIPSDAIMVAGYVDGLYKWSVNDWARFPNAIEVTIAVRYNTVGAMVYDVENGDLTPSQTPIVSIRELVAKHDPVFYVNRSNISAVNAWHALYKLHPPLLWVATLDGTLYPLTGNVVACQYAGSNRSGGHYDISMVIDNWPNQEESNIMDDDTRRTFAKMAVNDAAEHAGISLTDAELDALWPAVKLDFSNLRQVINTMKTQYAGKTE